MCDPCLDDEPDVDRMALAQTDCSENINMVLEWVADPNIPFDPVNPINHCALFLIACKFIPIRSKLCWYYPMVHQSTPKMLSEKPSQLKTPQYKKRFRPALVD